MISPISSFTYGRRWGGLRRFAKLFVSYKNEKITKSELINKKTNKKKRKPISNRVRATVLNRDKKTCQDCGKTVADGVTLEVHHIIPWSQGGGNSIDNLITNCFDCNNGKSDKVLD
jgi:5-methylcytosine-specific restriction endonuclease McrA